MSRSNLYRRLKQPNMKSRSRYNKADDRILLPMIRDICDQRPSNGYRRVTAHLNRNLQVNNLILKQVNHKRIYRIMKQNDLLLTRSEPLQNDRTHEGKVIVSESNMRSYEAMLLIRWL